MFLFRLSDNFSEPMAARQVYYMYFKLKRSGVTRDAQNCPERIVTDGVENLIMGRPIKKPKIPPISMTTSTLTNVPIYICSVLISIVKNVYTHY
jgi:hypothetical protein